MQRVTVSLDEETGAAFDALVSAQGYQSRSEAIRDLVRQAVDARRLDTSETHCVANLSYVYEYRTRDVGQRLLALQHAHHDLVAATMHVILDHESSFESMILKGEMLAVQALADAIRAERGVRFGAIKMVSVARNDDHRAGGDHHHGNLQHISPHRG